MRESPGGNSSRARSRCLIASPHLPRRTALTACAHTFSMSAALAVSATFETGVGAALGVGVEPAARGDARGQHQTLRRIIVLPWPALSPAGS